MRNWGLGGGGLLQTSCLVAINTLMRLTPRIIITPLLTSFKEGP